MSGDKFPFRRLKRHLDAQREDGTYPYSRIPVRQHDGVDIYELPLRGTAVVQVGVKNGKDIWFDVYVPDHGLVRIRPDTSLVSPIFERLENFLHKNGI